MKNKWVKRIATAVTALALAASVFTGLGNSAKATNGGNVSGGIGWLEDPGDMMSFTNESLDNPTLTLNNDTPFEFADIFVHVGPFYEEGYLDVPDGKMHVSVRVAPVPTANTHGLVDSAEYSFEFRGEKYSGTVQLTEDIYGLDPNVVDGWHGEDLIDVATDDDDDEDEDDDSSPSGSNDSKSSDAGSSSSSHKHHTHNWEWTAIVNATENQDGTYAMKCTRCKRVDESTITVVAKESVTSDKNLQILGSVKPGETIKLDTKGTAAFNQYFIAEIMKHSDSPVVVDFEYKNKKWTMTAPAGFNWAANLDANGWAGFMSVAQNNAEVTVTER